MKKYSYQIPERKIDETFMYNGNKYKVMDAAYQPICGKIGCTIKDPTTGNIKSLCTFEAYCGRINRRHRGYCTSDCRKDGKTVYFIKI